MLLIVNIYCFNVLLLNDGNFLVRNGFWQYSRAFETNYQPLVIYIMITSLIIILKWIVPKVASIYLVWNGNFVTFIPLFTHILQIHFLRYIWIHFYLVFLNIQTIRRQKPTNCLSVFDHFVGSARKGLTKNINNCWVHYQVIEFFHWRVTVCFFLIFQNIPICIKCFFSWKYVFCLRDNEISCNQIWSLPTIDCTMHNPDNAGITSWYNKILLNFVRGSFTQYVRKIFRKVSNYPSCYAHVRVRTRG